MSARFIVADVFDGLASIEDGSVDLVVTSPPFLALRSYLPADHPDKGKEIGSEPTPAEWLDTMLAVYAELRRVVADHGSVCFEVGDTYAGSGGAGGDYKPGGWRDGQPKADGSEKYARANATGGHKRGVWNLDDYTPPGGEGWPLNKCKALIPQLLEVALAYGFNPLTGQPSPAGRWKVRNVVTWARPNPPVGALGDKWRPATSDVVVACTSGKRYWDDLATRKPYSENTNARMAQGVAERTDLPSRQRDGNWSTLPERDNPTNGAGAPLLDYWEIPPGGYKGSHYAVFPEALVVPLVKAMCPQKVCRECGEPSRRIVENQRTFDGEPVALGAMYPGPEMNRAGEGVGHWRFATERNTAGFTDCGHDDYRPGVVLDPFAGSGTTLAVATGHGHDAIGIDLDERNAVLAEERIGGLFLTVEEL